MTEPTTAARGERHLATVSLAVLGVFVTCVPMAGVSTSLALIGEDTGASPTQLQWVSDAYIIPMAAAVLSAGVFGDLHGRRRVYALGMVLTVVGGLVAGLSALLGSATILVLCVGQMISGLGGGCLFPTTLALIAHAIPDLRERGRFIGLWASGILGGLAIGPIISGALVEALPWGWIYAPTVVLAISAGVLGLIRLPESLHPADRHLDWPGQITATLAIAGTIFGVIEAGTAGWSSPQALTGAAIGILGVAGFVLIERRSTAPLMDLSLFRSPAFTAAGLSALVAMFAVVGIIFLLSVYFGQVQGLTPLQMAWRLVFVTGTAVVLGPLVGRLMTVVKPILVLAVGLVMAAAGMLLLIGVNSSTGFGDLAWRLAVFGGSLALMLSAVSVAAVNAVPWQYSGMAAATNTALRLTGGAFGPAVLGAIYFGRLESGADPVAALHAAIAVTASAASVTAVVCLLSLLPQVTSSTGSRWED